MRSLLLVLAACGSDAIDATQYRELGRLDDPSFYKPRTLLVDGDIVYIGHRAGVVAVSLATTTPTIVGRDDFAQTSGREVERLFLYGDVLYAGYGDHFSVIDVSNRASPTFIKTILGNLQNTGDMGRIGNTLVLGGSTGLRFFDITDPTNPTDTAVYEQSQGSALNFVLDGSIAYLAIGGGAIAQKLVIMDLTTPPLGNREVLAEVPNVFGQLVKGGDTVYSTNLAVIDVSNPAAPIKRNTVDQVYASGSIAYFKDTVLITTPRKDEYGFLPAIHFHDPGDLTDLGNVEIELPSIDNIVTLATHGDNILALVPTGIVVVGVP